MSALSRRNFLKLSGAALAVTQIPFAVTRVVPTVVTARFKGSVAETIVLVGSDHTARQLAEGYLAQKWGLQGLLPAEHPYFDISEVFGEH